MDKRSRQCWIHRTLLGCIGRYGVFLLVWIALSRPAVAAHTVLYLPKTLDPAYDVRIELRITSHETSPFSIAFEETRANTGYRLAILPSRWTWTPQGRLASSTSGQLHLVDGQTITLTVKRRQDQIGVLVDSLLCGITPAPTPVCGTIRIVAIPSWARVGEVRYVPYSPRFFGDDFMRSAGKERLLEHPEPWVEDTTWQVAHYRKPWPGRDPHDPTTGRPMTIPWQLGIFPMTRWTPNGFWFLYTGTGPSWVVARSQLVPSSWDRYRMEVAVKPEYESAVGVIGAYQDTGSYLLFRWESATSSSPQPRAYLYAVQAGNAHLLATARDGFTPRQWYRLRLCVGWQRVEVWIDERRILTAANPGLVEGRVGLFAEGAVAPRLPTPDVATAALFTSVTGGSDSSWAMQSTPCILFDDVTIRDWETNSDLLATTAQHTGTWTGDGATYRAHTAGKRIGAITGVARYRMKTAIQLPPRGRGGLIIERDPSGNGYAWIAETTGMQLYRLAQDRRVRLLDHVDCPLPTEKWIPIEIEINGPSGIIRCQGHPLAFYDPLRQAGRCGVIAYTPGVAFRPLERTTEDHFAFAAPKLSSIITNDRWMTGWASAEACWRPASTAEIVTSATLVDDGAPPTISSTASGYYWHLGRHYHQVQITMPLQGVTLDGQVITLTTSMTPERGYTVRFIHAHGRYAVEVARATHSVARYSYDPAHWTHFVMTRHGGDLAMQFVAHEADGAPREATRFLGIYHDPQPLPASQVGFRVTDPHLPASAVQVVSDWQQETFTTAPTAWRTTDGVWGVMTRYSCDPRWNWFGGYGATTPAAWTKSEMSGDQIFQAYLGIKMDYYNVPEEYKRRFRDLNISICTDGHTLESGYTLARGRSTPEGLVIQLLRRGVVVWSSTAPADLMPLPAQGHRQWVALGLEQHGADVLIMLDERVVGTYHDPNPLPGGSAAIWTVKNGIVIGRVQYAAERLAGNAAHEAIPVPMTSNERKPI